MVVIVYFCPCSLFSGVKVAHGEGKQCHKKIPGANLSIPCCSVEMLLTSPALTCPLPQLKNTATHCRERRKEVLQNYLFHACSRGETLLRNQERQR